MLILKMAKTSSLTFQSSSFNRYQSNNAATVPTPAPQYNYPSAPGTAAPESYPGYDVYYSGYPPLPPHAVSENRRISLNFFWTHLICLFKYLKIILAT